MICGAYQRRVWHFRRLRRTPFVAGAGGIVCVVTVAAVGSSALATDGSLREGTPMSLAGGFAGSWPGSLAPVPAQADMALGIGAKSTLSWASLAVPQAC